MFSGLSYTDINNIASELNTKATSMETLLNAVQTQLNKVGDDGTWSGTAASNAKAEFDKLVAKFPDFKKAIEDCASYLNKVVENYQAVDNAVSGIE